MAKEAIILVDDFERNHDTRERLADAYYGLTNRDLVFVAAVINCNGVKLRDTSDPIKAVLSGKDGITASAINRSTRRTIDGQEVPGVVGAKEQAQQLETFDPDASGLKTRLLLANGGIVTATRGKKETRIWLDDEAIPGQEEALAVLRGMATAMHEPTEALALGIDIVEKTDGGIVVAKITHEPARITGDSDNVWAYAEAEATAMATLAGTLPPTTHVEGE